MLVAVADTHALIWYIFNDPRLSPNARRFFENAARSAENIGFSSVTLVELVYLEEKGRIHAGVLDRMITAADQPETVLVELSADRFTALSVRDVPREQVPDLPDRIISATALRYGVPLITRDHRIATSNVPTIW